MESIKGSAGVNNFVLCLKFCSFHIALDCVS